MTTQEQRAHTARHLAAHAVFALRAGFRIERLALNTTSHPHGGIVCDWKQGRAAYGDDTKLINRSFAFAYIGGIIDQEHPCDLCDEIQVEIKTDMEASEDSRETAVAWRLADSVQDTNSFAHVGYKLASRLIRKDKLLIDDLGFLLTQAESLDEASLLKWFRENASHYSLDELETINTY
jgi:hypothetical protein